MRRWSLLLLAAVAACGGGADCPLIGCVSQLSVQLPPSAVTARACVDGVCASEPVDGVLQVPLNRRAEGTTVALVVELVDASGAASTVRGDVPVQRTRPGGEECTQTCVNGSVRVDGTGRLVVAQPTGP